MRPITQHSIAKELGISRSTVAAILSEQPRAKLRVETRQRVLETAGRLGYRPNAIARAMARGKTHSIGVVTFASPALMNMEHLVSIHNELERTGWRMQLVLRK